MTQKTWNNKKDDLQMRIDINEISLLYSTRHYPLLALLITHTTTNTIPTLINIIVFHGSGIRKFINGSGLKTSTNRTMPANAHMTSIFSTRFSLPLIGAITRSGQNGNRNVQAEKITSMMGISNSICSLPHAIFSRACHQDGLWMEANEGCWLCRIRMSGRHVNP